MRPVQTTLIGGDRGRWAGRALAVLGALILAACSSGNGATTSTESADPAVTSSAPGAATSAPQPATTAVPAPTSGSAPGTPPAASPTDAPLGTVSAAASPVPTAREMFALGRPVILAHAGGEDVAPHSTLFAYGEAVRAGVDVLDVDLQLTADGVLVIQHDDRTGRTTEADVVVAETPFAELHRLDDAYWFTETCTCKDQPGSAYLYRGMRTGEVAPPAGYTPDDFAIPAFRELLERYPRFVVNIEIKGKAPAAFAAADALAALLSETGAGERVIVTSFDDAVVDHFHAAAPDVLITPGLQMSTAFVLGGTPPPAWAPLMQVPPNYEGIEVFTPAYVAASHAAGLRTWVWPNGEGEDVAGYSALLDLGADGINASNPPAAIAALHAFATH